MRERGISPVVGKLFELVIGLGLIGIVTVLMMGMVVPGHADDLGEQSAMAVLDRLAAPIEAGGWDATTTVGTRQISVGLPPTIAGHAYRIDAQDGRLQLKHPVESFELSRRIRLPEGCRVEGAVSGGAVRIRVIRTPSICLLTVEVADAV
jgi:hypothetical protein